MNEIKRKYKSDPFATTTNQTRRSKKNKKVALMKTFLIFGHRSVTFERADCVLFGNCPGNNCRSVHRSKVENSSCQKTRFDH